MPTNFPTQQQMDVFEHAVHMFISVLPRIGLVIALTAIGILLLVMLLPILLRLLNIYRIFKREVVFLELTPPAFTDKTPAATQALISVLHGYQETRSIPEKLLQQKATFTLEMPAAREQGTRAVICVPKCDRRAFEKDIASYSPDVRVREVQDYLPENIEARNIQILEFHETKRFYPLRKHDSLEEMDPAAYTMGNMADLKSEEIIAVQLVVSPIKLRSADRLAAKLLYNELRIKHLDQGKGKAGESLKSGINSLMFGITGTVSDIYHSSSSSVGPAPKQNLVSYYEQVAAGIKPAVTMGSLEEGVATGLHEKLNEPLFAVSIRVLIAADNKQDRVSKAREMRKAFSIFSTRQQGLKSRFDFPYGVKGKYRLIKFKHRLPALFDRNCSILSASEVANIYHFPHSESGKVDGKVASLSRTLAPTPAFRNVADTGGFDVIIGRNLHHGSFTDIGLTAKQRSQHMYIIGATGSGKTTMLLFAILQDIQQGKGVAIIDPHGDMAKLLLKYIPAERLDDVVYFNPFDASHPIGVNLLEIPEGLTGDELLLAQDFVAESVVSIFRKVFSEDDSGGHRIENGLRYGVHTAFTVEGATLFTVRRLFNDPDYLKQVVSKIEDKDIRDFWIKEYGLAGNYQKYKAMDGIITKIGRFQRSVVTRRILEQPKSTINFNEILDGKILICNLPKGSIGEDTSRVLGTAILTQLQLAAYRRIHIDEEDRKPFYLYVDEFQNFVSPLFMQMLSESRKYRLYVTMAEQSTSQQDRQLVENILDNAGTVVCFRTGNPADEELMLHQFGNYIKPGEITQLPVYNFFVRIAAQQAQETLSGETIKIENAGSTEIAECAIEASRRNYAITYEPKKHAVASKKSVPARNNGTKTARKKRTGIPKRHTRNNQSE